VAVRLSRKERGTAPQQAAIQGSEAYMWVARAECIWEENPHLIFLKL